MMSTANQMKDLREQSTVVPNMMDIRPWILYDRVDVEPGECWPPSRRYDAFLAGEIRRGLKYTNMMMPGSLPAPQQFLLQAIYCLYSPDHSERRIFDDLTWLLMVGNKGYGKGPLPFIALPATLDTKEQRRQRHSPPDGVQLRSEDPDSVLGEIKDDSWITPPTMWPVSEKGLLTIETQQLFWLQIEGELQTDSEPLTMWFCLEGLLVRAVQ